MNFLCSCSDCLPLREWIQIPLNAYHGIVLLDHITPKDKLNKIGWVFLLINLFGLEQLLDEVIQSSIH